MTAWAAAFIGLLAGFASPVAANSEPYPDWPEIYTPPPPSRSVSGTHCRRGETIVFSCNTSTGRLSVCIAGQDVLYRFGPAGRPDIELGRSQRPVRQSLGNKDASMDRLRFETGRYSYRVYELSRGNRGPIAGVEVWLGDRMISDRLCRGRWAPLNTRILPRLKEDTDPRFYGQW